MAGKGIRILNGTPLTDIRCTARGVSGKVGDETLRAEYLLVSIGRRPATAGLNLTAAGVKTSERGFIEVDDDFRTSAPGIYAIGDAVGKIMLAHWASAAAEAAELNVLVNTGLLAPDDRAATEARAARLRATVVQCCAQTADAVRAALRGEG